MEITIHNQPGGIIQQTDKPIINNFGHTVEEEIKITQSILGDSEAVSITQSEPGIQPKRKVGRPSAENIPFEHFVKNKPEANNVLESLRQQISQTDGTAPKLGAVMGGMVGNQLAKVIPYKVLKREFGELIVCAESDYNKQVANLR